MFFSKSQEELDAAFLEAVSAYKFEKAKKLLQKGASVHAEDVDGNTALHKLGQNNPDSGDCCRGDFDFQWHGSFAVDNFVCFLLERGFDINKKNKQQKTCLHTTVAAGYQYTENVLKILLNRGADSNALDVFSKTPLYYSAGSSAGKVLIGAGATVNVRDLLGETPLHAAAAAGRRELANCLLEQDETLIAVQDNTGKYAYESAIEGVAGHHDLSRMLQEKLKQFKNAKTVVSAPKVEEPVQVVESTPAEWVLLQDPEKLQIAHVQVQPAIGYKLTEIFNFRARMYTQIVQNMGTKLENVTMKSFDEFTNKAFLEEARAMLLKQGGQVDEAILHGPMLQKESAKLKNTP